MIRFKGLLLCLVLMVFATCLAAQTQDWLWVTGAGGTSNDTVQAIATDSAGNSYVTGYFASTANFGSTTLTSSGGDDIFVAKLDTSGNWLWAKNAGGSGTDYGNGIAVDSAGNVYLTGYFSGTASFGSIPLTSSGVKDIFAAKLDTSGNWLWAKQAGGSSTGYGNGIAVDSSANVYLTGFYYGNASFGSIPLTSSGGDDIFVAKLDTNGNWLWAKKAGGTGYDYGNGIAVDSFANVYLTGYFSGTASFGSIPLSSSGSYDIFVAKLDTNGNWLWAKKAGGTGSDHGIGIAVDSSANVYLTGYFQSTASLGSTSLTSSGSNDIFAAKLDTSGNWLWAKQAGGTSDDYGNGIAVDSSGNVYLTGSFAGIASFGSSSLSSSNSYSDNIFVAKLDTSGNWIWAKKSDSNSDYGVAIAVDSSTNVYLTGYFWETASFGSTTLTSSGSSDIFVAKMTTLNAAFSASITSGLEPLSVQFTDLSTIGDYPIANWFWTFGDGDTSTQQHPLHTYLTHGIYTVSLTVLDSAYHSSTHAEPNYITVVERVYAIELLSPDQLSFGNVYLEEQSPLKPVILANTGNVDITISNVHFLASNSHFELGGSYSGLVITTGTVDTLWVRFAPQTVGALADTLYIVNNSTNMPVLKIKLSGTGQYVLPKPPENVVITMLGTDALVTWDAVSLNEHNQPLTPDYYIVYYNGSSDIDGLYYYLSSGIDLSYTHVRVGMFAEHMFYRVRAYKYYGRRQLDIGSLGLSPRMTEAQVSEVLRSKDER